MLSEKDTKARPIFVVDDDPAILNSIQRLLKAHGFEVRTFDSAEGFRTLPDPDEGLCLVLDVNLNGSSGIELSRQLAASGNSLPVIFITANDNKQIQRSAIDAGCVAYLIKPFSSRSLLRAIERAAALRRRSSAGLGCANRKSPDQH